MAKTLDASIEKDTLEPGTKTDETGERELPVSAADVPISELPPLKKPPEAEEEIPWKILIVDDEPGIHATVRFILRNFHFDSRPVELLSAYSGAEAKSLLNKNPDIALVLLDVVMETRDAGLRVVEYIRKELQNQLVRIVLHTGQPNQVPESATILTYDINDYKSKFDITPEKLITTVVAALRSYRDAISIETSRKEIVTLNEALKAFNQYLEELVEARTQELELKTQQLQREIHERQQAETALRLSEEKFSKAFRSSPDPIVIVRLADETCIEINDSFVNILGYGRNEAIGRSFSELNLWTNDHDRSRLGQLLANSSAFRNQEFTYRAKSGELRTMLVSGEMIHLGGDPCLLAIGNDVTECTRVESELREKEQYLRLILDNIPQHVFWKDTNQTFQGCNRNWAQAAGLQDPEEVVGKTDYDLLPNKEMARDLCAQDRSVIETGQPILNLISPSVVATAEEETTWLSISKIPILELTGEVVGVLGVIDDITERRKVEQDLRLTQFFLDRSRDYVLFLDENARFCYVNEAACQTLGYSRQALLEMTIHDIDPNFPKTEWASRWHTLRQQQSITSESLHRTRTGQLINVEMTFNYLEYADREYVCAIVRDIRDRKQSEVALHQAKETADAANHAKSEFLAKMSHELRTPLNAILGFTQILSGDSSLNTEQKEYADIINRSGEHLLALINDVLEMSKIEEGKIALNSTRFNLREMLSNLEEMLQLKARAKGLQLSFHLSTDLPRYVQIDEGKLRQVLINLLSNAIKFTQVGSVTLEVSPVAECVDSTQQSRLRFIVEDTGPGISNEESKLLFAPFVQTDVGRQIPEGSGLGLSISQQFVKLMGGEISVSSTLQGGSQFYFEIDVPITDRKEAFLARARNGQQLAPGQPNYRILVVEDDRMNRALLIKLLSKIGFQVREATNGEEGIEIWQSWQPHLIWMDMQMPVMDGYQATREIKAAEQAALEAGQAIEPTTIVALTASAFREEQEAIFAAGCDDLLNKPFRKEELLDKMAEHLGVRYLQKSSQQPETPTHPVTRSQSETDISGEALQQLRTDALRAMPQPWIVQLHHAAAKGSDRAILELLAQLPADQSLLAEALRDWTTCFRFDKIVELTQPALE